MTPREIRNDLVKKSIKKLKRYGFRNVDAKNILTDEVYTHYFIQFLYSSIGKSMKIDDVIVKILREIDPALPNTLESKNRMHIKNAY